ncbi:MAG: hypothetical protein JXM70_03355 [Pirellulales bacterium]|nr:hypothetical protein [Pirellulales bacterium]
MSVSEASGHFDEVVDRVASEGITVELERDHRVVARISPATPVTAGIKELKVSELNKVFSELPRLGKEEAEAFARDIDEARKEIPPESDPWG